MVALADSRYHLVEQNLLSNIQFVSAHTHIAENRDLASDIKRYARYALMFARDTREILPTLTYNQAVFDNLIDSLDEQYQTIENSIESYQFDREISSTVEELLTQIIGLINDLQTTIIEKTHDLNLSK